MTSIAREAAFAIASAHTARGGLDHPDWDSLRVALDLQRARVSAEFAELLAPRQRDTAPDALALYWRALPDGGDVETLAASGFADARTASGDLHNEGPSDPQARESLSTENRDAVARNDLSSPRP